MLENISEFFQDYWFLVLIVLAILLLVGGLIWSSAVEFEEDDKKIEIFAKTTGYEKGDIEVFIELMGFDIDDIIKSQAVRRQLQMFVEGEKSFYPEAQNRKAVQAAESAKSSANTAQIMSTVALVNSMNKR